MEKRQTSFSVLILIVLPAERERKGIYLSAILEQVPRTIIYIYIYNTLHKEISTFYDYVNKKCVQH